MHSTRLPTIVPTPNQTTSSFEQLNLKPQSLDDRLQMTRVLTSYLNYPSDAQAETHYQAYRLGQLDERSNRLQLKRQFVSNGVVYKTCPCCCYLVQTPLDFCVPISDVVTLGTAHRIFFQDIIMCTQLMVISLLIYGIYAFVTNITVSNQNPVSCAGRRMCGLALIALGPKLNNNQVPRAQYLFVVQAYLGLAMIVVWTAIFILKVFSERQIRLEQDRISPTVANFSVMFENLPKDYTVNLLQAKLNEYAARVKPLMIHPSSTVFPNDPYDVGFTIVAMNSARAYYVSLRLAENTEPIVAEEELAVRYQILKNTILYRGQYGVYQESPELRQQLYAAIDFLKLEVANERVQNLKTIESLYLRNDASTLTKTAFVTFSHTYAKTNMLRLNQGSFLGRIFGCCTNKQGRLDIPGLVVTSAPEPEDIIWENVGVPWWDIAQRKIITYSASALLLAISFGAIIGLSFAQKSGNNVTISLLISAIVNVINIILSLVIQYLTVFEKDYTTTLYQASVGFKIIFSQLINSIILSIIVARYIKKNIYEQGGLVDDVFYFAALNAILPPLVRLINPYYIWTKILLGRSRNPVNKLDIEAQIEYNRLWEDPEFQIGLQYAYPIRTVIYTAFFMSLQPIIIVFAIVGLIIDYQVEKFALYYRSMRPRSSSVFINQAMKRILYICIIAYGFGSLSWSNFLPNSYPKRAFIPSVIAIAIGIVLYIVILSDALRAFFVNYFFPSIYDNQRIFFPSEYDRLNPATRAKGVYRFMSYLNRKRAEIASRSNLSLETEVLINDNGRDVDALLQMTKYTPANQAALLATVLPFESNLLASTHIPQYNLNNAASSRNIQLTTSTWIPAGGSLMPLGVSIPMAIPLPQPITINANVLGDVMANNERPGEQRPNLFSSAYNPLDFIEAAESNIDRMD